jgi:hypothetical protein
MALDHIVQIHRPSRERLRRLDSVLDDLEDLNLSDLSEIPVRIGDALIDLGVDDPYLHSITELIDRVFELQEPVLAAVRSESALIRTFRTA